MHVRTHLTVVIARDSASLAGGYLKAVLPQVSLAAAFGKMTCSFLKPASPESYLGVGPFFVTLKRTFILVVCTERVCVL